MSKIEIKTCGFNVFLMLSQSNIKDKLNKLI